MDDTLRVGADQPIGVDVCHHIMADLFLFSPFGFVVDIRDMGFKFRDLLGSHRQAQFRLGAGEFDPQPAPGLIAFICGKKLLHLL